MTATSSEPLGREKRHSRFSLPNGGVVDSSSTGRVSPLDLGSETVSECERVDRVEAMRVPIAMEHADNHLVTTL